MNYFKKGKLTPFFLTAVIIIADQITKTLIVRFVEYHTVGFSLFDDFFRIIYTRNTGIAFSLGANLPEGIKLFLFIFFPILVLAGLVYFSLKSNMLTKLQRWALAGILGGGLGNMIDRMFYSDGVIDFIDVKFYGIFGLERWPTFNIADASVVVCGIILIISFLVEDFKKKDE